MALYNNINKNSPIAAVEFSPVSSGNSTFIHLNAGSDAATVKQWLTQDIGQQIEAEAKVGNQTVLVTRGDKTQDQIMEGLSARGAQLSSPASEKRRFRPWVWRGNISIVGQSLQLTSGLTAAKLTDEAKAQGKTTASRDKADYKLKGMDNPIIIFAVSNLLANFTNIFFGAQKAEDTLQLRFLKEQSNKIIAPYLQADAALPAVNEKRSDLRKEPEKPKYWDEKFRDFMKRNSVRFGEIGLRYFGSLALAFPLENWKKSFGLLSKGELKNGVKAAFNHDKFSGWTGVAYMVGKTIAFFSKVPDPYEDPKKHTWIDTIREKYLFKLSSGTEAVAASLLAYNGLAKKRVFYKGEIQRDYPGGTGGLLFASGLLIRLFAPFGTKELNIEEVYANITDGLAKIQEDKLPEAIGKNAAFLTNHFKANKLEFGQVYTKIATDLYRYHHIALPNAATSPETALSNTPLAIEHAEPAPADTAPKFSSDEMKKPALTVPPPAAYSDKVASSGMAMTPALA